MVLVRMVRRAKAIVLAGADAKAARHRVIDRATVNAAAATAIIAPVTTTMPKRPTKMELTTIATTPRMIRPKTKGRSELNCVSR
jgi:hypothetical protein